MLTKLKTILDDVAEGYISERGVVIIIKGALRFDITDGYIKFMKMALDGAVNRYKIQDDRWKNCLGRIYTAAEKLQDKNVRFTGTTKKEFKEYCNRLSRVMKEKTDRLPLIELDIAETDLTEFLKKHMAAGDILGFYYDEKENAAREHMNDLAGQVSKLKFEKGTRMMVSGKDISFFLMESGYHEHVHDALNILINTAAYAVNCTSTRKGEAFDFDIYEIEKRLRQAELVMESIKDLV